MVCCLLSAVCCLLSAVCCLLSAVCGEPDSPHLHCEKPADGGLLNSTGTLTDIWHMEPLRVAADRRPRSLDVPVVIVVLLAGIIAGMLMFPASATTLGPLAMLVAHATATATILGKARRLDGRDRIAWSVIGYGFAVGTAGILVVVTVGAIVGELPAFGPLDLFFLANYGLVLVGFFHLPHLSVSRAEWFRVYLDGLIGALAVAAIMWIVALDDLVYALADSTAWERWVGTAYPVLDVTALIVAVIVVSRRSAFRFDPRLLFFALGLLVQVVADLSFLKAGLGNTFAETEPNYVAFVIASSLYVAAARLVDRQPEPREYADRSASLLSMVLPYTAAMALVSVLVWELRDAGVGAHTQVALIATAGVVVLVSLRQGVAIRENRRLVERQRSDLVASISHELRTPLTAVVGFLDMVTAAESALSETERRELTGIALQQAMYLETIVSDVAPLRAALPDDLVLAAEETSVREVVERTLEMVDCAATRLRVDVPEALQAEVDPRRVQQALINLISNAVRYGGGRVVLAARAHHSDLVIEVHDDGPGVPPKWELAIWNRFERGPNRFNAAQPGTGVGLAVVAAIAKAHGGSAGYRRSDVLEGSCFSVCFPKRVVGRVAPPELWAA